MSIKVMHLIDENTGRMECKVCGSQHYGSIRPDSEGQYFRENYQCANGCNAEVDKESGETVRE